MPLSEIKEEFKNKRIAFGKGGYLPIGQREDIDELAIIAQESQDPSLVKLFKKLPDLSELKKAKTESQLKRTVTLPTGTVTPGK
jgi:hypothetical protein